MITIDSYDCARINMGFTRLEVNPPLCQILLPRFINVEDELGYLESCITDMDKLISQIIDIKMFKIMNLGTEVEQWHLATNLKSQVEALPYAEGSRNMIYEFQMDMNNKSQAIGNMLVYEYASRSEIHRVQPAQKNTVTLGNMTREKFLILCPKMAKRKYTTKRAILVDLIFSTGSIQTLNIQTFLRIFPSTYTANKTHCATML